jgi:hypothetical protein
MADTLDMLGRPPAVTLDAIARAAAPQFQEWLHERKNRRRIPHRLEECGYVPVRNDDATDGLWRISGKRQVVYAKCELSFREQSAAVTQLSASPQRLLPPPPA